MIFLCLVSRGGVRLCVPRRVHWPRSACRLVSLRTHAAAAAVPDPRSRQDYNFHINLHHPLLCPPANQPNDRHQNHSKRHKWKLAFWKGKLNQGIYEMQGITITISSCPALEALSVVGKFPLIFCLRLSILQNKPCTGQLGTCLRPRHAATGLWSSWLK